MIVKPILWFKEVNEEDLNLVGGKGLNLGLMAKANFPIPEGFIVTTNAYWYFLEKTGIKTEVLSRAEKINVDNTIELEKESRNIRELIISKNMPEELKIEIIKAYKKLGEENIGWLTSEGQPFVAVRSSASAEDLPSASFAGQQETFLNVHGKEELINSVKKCWASLFTARAIYYRRKNNFPEQKVGIAIVIQKMIDSDISGVVFTADPTGDTSKIVIEAIFGLGEAIVSGSVIPDNYVVNKEDLTILNTKISKQEWMFSKSRGKTEKVFLNSTNASKQKLSNEKIIQLASICKEIEEFYNVPQDIEFAISQGRIFIVQSRPITTLKLKEKIEKERTLSKIKAEPLIEGLAASPGIVTGKVKIVPSINDIGKVQEKDILVTKMTNPDWVPIMKKASAIITDEGGTTCHAAIVSRELGIPCIVGTVNATKILKDDLIVTVNGFNGKVYEGEIAFEIKEKLKKFVPIKEEEIDEFEKALMQSIPLEEEKIEEKAFKEPEIDSQKRIEEERLKIIKKQKDTAIEILKEFGRKKTEELSEEEKQKEIELISKMLEVLRIKVKVNVALPEAAEKAAKTNADGVGLLRAEHMITAEGKHPAEYIRMGQGQELIRAVREGIKKVAIHFKDKPVWYRTFDARTDEFRHLKGGDLEPKEDNPMLGWHGIRRDLEEKNIFKAQLIAIKQLREEGFTNIGVMLPFVSHVEQVIEAKKIMQEVNLKPEEIDFGVMIETPAAVWIIDELINEGIKFVSFGTNDLTQLTLGVDRNNERIQKWFSELHPAILRQLHYVISKCKPAKIETSICGQAGSNPEMVRKLVYFGIDSVSANIDAVEDIRKLILEEEKNIILGKIKNFNI